MNSRHLVDAELEQALTQLPSFDVSAETLPSLRSMPFAEAEASDAVERRELSIPGPAGSPPLRVLIYTPRSEAALMPALLHIHGGGYLIGKPEISDVRNRALCAELGCLIVSVDYRLAPEHPFPAAIEDCYAALHWLYSQTDELKLDRTRIAVGGESAGGGLAAALALMARDRGEVPLCFQLLIFPMIDDRTGSVGEPHPYTGEFIWTAASNRFGWQALLGIAPGSDGVSPYAAAARAENLAGLAPAFISVGALDLFVEEDIEYARRLIRAGVPTELHVYPGAYHGFMLAPQARITLTADRDAAQALQCAFTPR